MGLLKGDTVQDVRRKMQKALSDDNAKEFKALISNTRSLDLLHEIRAQLEITADKAKELYSKKSELWANDVHTALLRYCNNRIEQLEEEQGAKDLLIEIGVPYDPVADDFYGV
ncbi:MAG: hypothetical protein IJ065_06295 [Eubacterium sp.]|nr:hypothetical protein [Eubacterium sp.]